MNRKPIKITGWGKAWAFVGAGVAFLLFTIWLMSEASQSTSWPTVQGRITSYRLVGNKSRHGIRVTYSYRVERRPYSSNVYSHGSAALPGTYDSQVEALGGYANDFYYRPWRPGQPVTVYYHPNDPAQSVLMPGNSDKAWGGSFFLVICLLAIGLYKLANLSYLAFMYQNR